MILIGKKRFLELIILVLLSLHAQAQYFQLLPASHRQRFHFKIVRNLIVLPVSLNGKGNFNFILDTGVGFTIITDPSLKDSANIQSFKRISVLGLGDGGECEALITNPIQMAIKGTSIVNTSCRVAIFTNDYFDLSSYLGIPVHGLIGYDFFSNLAVKIDFTDSTLTVAPSGAFKAGRKFQKIPLILENNRPVICGKVRFENQTEEAFNLLTDLGGDFYLSLIGKAKNQWPLGKCISANLGIALNGPVNGEMSRINHLQLAGYDFTSVISNFPNIPATLADNTRQGSIGMQILKRFTLIFDYMGGYLMLKRNFSFKEPFDHDMSGLEYYTAGPGLKRIVISRVETESAATEAGIEKNDEILSVNFKPVTQLTLADLDNIFKSKEGRQLILKINRDQQQTTVILTLKKRI